MVSRFRQHLFVSNSVLRFVWKRGASLEPHGSIGASRFVVERNGADTNAAAAFVASQTAVCAVLLHANFAIESSVGASELLAAIGAVD